MKVILLKDIKGLGKNNALVEVNDGYAINYLIPKKLAKAATPSHLEIRNNELQINNEKMLIAREEALVIKEKLENLMLRFTLKVGTTGRAHHSISKRQIEEFLLSSGFDVSRLEIPPTHVNSIGISSVKISIKVLGATRVIAVVKMEVVASGE